MSLCWLELAMHDVVLFTRHQVATRLQNVTFSLVTKLQRVGWVGELMGSMEPASVHDRKH